MVLRLGVKLGGGLAKLTRRGLAIGLPALLGLGGDSGRIAFRLGVKLGGGLAKEIRGALAIGLPAWLGLGGDSR